MTKPLSYPHRTSCTLNSRPKEAARAEATFKIRDLTQSAWLKLAGVVLVGLIARLIGLGRQSLWFDEAYSVFVAKLPLDFSFDVLISDGVHPPLYYLLQRVTLPLGEGEAALRLPSMLIGVFAIPLIYLVGHQLANERTALVAALLVALSPFLIWYSQEARMYSPLMTLSVLIMLTYTRTLRPDRHRGASALFAISSSLAYLTHYFALFLPLIQLAHIGVNFRRLHGVLRRWTFLQLLAVLPLLVWVYQIYQQPEAFFGIGWIKVPQLVDLWHTLLNFSLGFVSAFDAIRWGAALLLVALAFLGARSGWRVETGASLVVLWALLPIILTYLFSLRRPVYIDRFLILSAPAWLLLAAKGLDSFRKRAFTVAVSAVVLLWIYGVATYNFGPGQLKEDWRSAGQYLSQPRADEVLVVRTLQMVIPMAYYHPNYEGFKVVEVNREITPISEIAKGHAGTWLLYWNAGSDAHSVAATTQLSIEDESIPEIASWMSGRGPEILERTDYRGLTIFHFNGLNPGS